MRTRGKLLSSVAVGLAALGCLVYFVSPAAGGPSFVNWESSHVHPIDVTPSGGMLLAVNTPDNRLEVWQMTGPNGFVWRGSVPVGLDPVTVRARGDSEAWVVNRISDTVSIVDLDALAVIATIPTSDEPGDVVFAQGRAFISCGTLDQVHVYDLPYDAGDAPAIVGINGENPTALATDGSTVYCLIFLGGNRTSVLHHSLVTNGFNPYGAGINPVPNLGTSFDPPINPGLPGVPPRESLIVKQTPGGSWLDDNDHDWTPAITYELHGHAMAHIDASSLAVTYTNDLMAINTALDVNPVNGKVAVVGMHAFNHVRFEPLLSGRFAEMGEAIVEPGGGPPDFNTINPHLAAFYPADPHSADGFAGLPPPLALAPSLLEQTIGDPQGVAWSPDGTYKFVTGRGSNNIAKSGLNGERVGQLAVGEGPGGVVFDPVRPRAYVLNRFGASISVIDTNGFAVARTLDLPLDPTPPVIRQGRPRFYSTTAHSPLGNLSCATCHVDGDADRLAWNLGDPSGEMKEFNQTCIGGVVVCNATDWHPMKGPMTTQSLLGIIGSIDTVPLHWRGDREDLAAFNPAFGSLLGSSELSPEEMQEFNDYVATLTYPPNPFRNRDGSLKTTHFNGGNPQNGDFLFNTPPTVPQTGGPQMGDLGHLITPEMIGPRLGADGMLAGQTGGGVGCTICHAPPTGSTLAMMPAAQVDSAIGIWHLIKVAPMRDAYRKDGAFIDLVNGTPSSRGTGFLHDGSFPRLMDFIVTFFDLITTTQEQRDIEAFLHSFGTDTHAGVGSQVTLSGAANGTALRDELVAIAETGAVGLVAKGRFLGERRGFQYLSAGNGTFQSDRLAQIVSVADLDSGLEKGDVLTYTLVPAGSEARIGIDRDEDGHLDQDELDLCFDPSDAESFPGVASCCGDFDGSGSIGFADLTQVLLHWGPCIGPCPWDFDGNLAVGFGDLTQLLLTWGACDA